MKNFVPRKKKIAILSAMLSLSFSNSVFASDTDYVYYDGKKFIEFEFFNKDEFTSQYTLADILKNATKSATSYWSGILGSRSKYSSPWQIMVTTKSNYQNADASTLSYINREDTYDNYISQMLQGNKTLNYFNLKPLANTTVEDEDYDAANALINENIPDGNVAFSVIEIGQNIGANRTDAIDGWWIDTDTVLPTNEQAADFVSTFRHELGHALGISSVTENCDWDGNIIEDEEDKITFGENELTLSKFADDTTDTNNWIYHLQDQNGNFAKPGMLIITSEAFSDIKAENPNAIESDYFIVDEGNFSYFVGDNVTAALDGATFNGVSGLPVNTWEEGEDGIYFEGSHLQTAGMMSHRYYSNYTNFMEVELAAMQDLGYDIDRKAYYGYSVYGNGGTINNTQGYFARSEDGTAYTSDYSQIPLGVGLHVYGSNNNVTQSANILTRGTGAVGIRVDGESNTINIPTSTEIHADGLRGKGILISYGRNQNLNLDGTVTAEGEGGNAVEFNFGSSSNGASDEYRGSYIRYYRYVNEDDGEITVAGNLDLNDMNNNEYNSSADELNGELVTDFNLSGKITGGENAVYIGKNAFVKNININDGADINGNITSDWKNFSEDDGIFSESQYDTEFNVETIEPLKLQYKGGEYVYTKYIPDLVTNLNFNADNTYSGNINGADNIKLNINGGNFNYGGTANVVNVNVANGAKVLGGTYTVNDMTENLATGFSDATTGKFYNHGTISGLTINGNLISDGNLTDESGIITVNGSADVNGSTVYTTKELEINESAEILNATSITGTLANSENNPTEISALLGGYGEISSNKINYTISFADNFGDLDANQTLALNGLKTLSTALKNDSRKTELTPLYTLDAATAKLALSQIGNADATHMMSLAQQNSYIGKVLSERLTTAFSNRNINFNVGANNFADSDESILMGVSADYPARVNNDFWIKFTKNWGELNGGADYHGQAISGGYDRPIGGKWRTGLFLSYDALGLSTDNFCGNIYGTRCGIYTGYHNDVDDGLFYINFGRLRNKINRSISALGFSTEANFESSLLEIGGEYRRNLTPYKSWNISPFINLRYSHLRQEDYYEKGAGIYDHYAQFESNSYVAGQLGFEFKRNLNHGDFSFRIGANQALKVADPNFKIRFAGNFNDVYILENSLDKTHVIASLSGENQFHGGWILGGNVGFQKGSHDKDLSASVMLRKVW